VTGPPSAIVTCSRVGSEILYDKRTNNRPPRCWQDYYNLLPSRIEPWRLCFVSCALCSNRGRLGSKKASSSCVRAIVAEFYHHHTIFFLPPVIAPSLLQRCAIVVVSQDYSRDREPARGKSKHQTPSLLLPAREGRNNPIVGLATCRLSAPPPLLRHFAIQPIPRYLPWNSPLILPLELGLPSGGIRDDTRWTGLLRTRAMVVHQHQHR
jgi:hypothetical protein